MLAADYVAVSLENRTPHALTLFARDPKRAHIAQRQRGISAVPDCHPLDAFDEERWDAIINFVGVGDPARAVAMGADILGVTSEWDSRVLAYLDGHAQCRYIFLSSGAAFGEGVGQAVDEETRATFAINALPSSSYYGIAKFYAEALHRARTDRSIIDIRVFNYLSDQADLDHRFLITEAIAAIRDDRTLSVDAREMWRDYLGQEDFAALVDACLGAPAGYNGAVDGYSRAPISKTNILALLHDKFTLRFHIAGGGIDATGTKSNYYSCNRVAGTLGYAPRFASSDTLESVTRRILGR